MSSASVDERLFHAAPLDIEPLTPRVGALIRGVRLSPDLRDDVGAAIRRALMKFKVLFFRGQEHLDDASHRALTALLHAEPAPHPTVPANTDTELVYALDSKQHARQNTWHTDVSFIDAYPSGAILRALIIPRAGGDTIWANTAAAYDDLPPTLRALAEGLWAIHSNDYDYQAQRPSSASEAKRIHDIFASTVFETEHPVVHVHPVTGERALLLGHFARSIADVSVDDSTQLLRLLQRYITRPENTVRWRWTVGDVAIWDNRATQHYAINDYGSQRRLVRRVAMLGSVATSVDGRCSTVRRGSLRAACQ